MQKGLCLSLRGKVPTRYFMAIDWTQTYEKYKGLWVALKDDDETVVGSGGTAREALDSAIQNGYQEPILTRMPETLMPFVG